MGEVIILDSTFATINSANIGTAGIGSAYIGDLYVTGPSTFSNNVYIKGTVVIDGDLSVTGVATYQQLDAAQSQIGILTVSNYLDVNNIIQETTGFSTFSNFTANSGVITSITAENINNSGVVTSGNIDASKDLTVGRNLFQTAGIATLGTPDPVAGFVTCRGDLYIGGDLYVRDDIRYDEIVGRNLSISGVGTIADLRAGIGSIADLRGTRVRYQTGIITNLFATEAQVGEFIGTTVTAGDLTVSGASTITGIATFQNNVFVDGNYSSTGNVDINGNYTGANITVDTNVIGSNADFDTGIIDSLVSQKITSGSLNVSGVATVSGTANITYLNVAGVTTSPQIFSSVITNAGLLTTGTLFVDSLASIDTLIVNDTALFKGDATFETDVSISGDTILSDFLARNAQITGIASITQTKTPILRVNGSFDAVGVATFQTGLRVSGGALFVDSNLFANSGFITAITGTTLNYTDGTITNDLIVNNDLTVGNNAQITGVATAIVLEAQQQLTSPLLNVSGVGTIGFLEATNGRVSNTLNVSNLIYNTGIGTQLQVTDLTATTAESLELNVTGIATAARLVAPLASVGVVTVTSQVDINDTTTIDSYKVSTTSTSPTAALTLDSTIYKSFEFTIQGTEGTNFHAAKIHGVADNANTKCIRQRILQRV